jgi:hypothetical protein
MGPSVGRVVGAFICKADVQTSVNFAKVSNFLLRYLLKPEKSR